MDNTINNDIIEKVTIKSVAIYKAIGMLPPIETKDLWEEKNSIEHQKNYENKNVSEINDTMKDTKMPSIPNDWRDITDPKLRKKMYRKAYYEANKIKEKQQQKIYKKIHHKHLKHKKKLRDKILYESNKEKRKLQIKAWKIKNKDNVKLKLSEILRSRLRIALKNNYKSGSAVRDLGCSIEEFKSYLESTFQPGMSWDNYGLYGWHIDHIKPLASFDLTDRKQMLEACHYTNLQPLWATDNLSKGDNLI